MDCSSLELHFSATTAPSTVEDGVTVLALRVRCHRCGWESVDPAGPGGLVVDGDTIGWLRREHLAA